MANGYYKALYKAYTNFNKERNKNTKSTSSKIKDTKSSITSAENKLKSRGISTDTRNFVEKTLGLPDDQNFIFDFFELLGRPQQALFGAIEANMSGGDAGQAALEHLKGNKRTTMKDILEYDASLAANDEKGKLDLIDALGFAGDVLLDPVDLIPVAGFGKFADAIKAGDSVKDASKYLRSTSDVVMGGVVKGAKGAVKGADTAISSVLKNIDASKGIDYLKPTAKSAANLGKTINSNTIANIAEDIIRQGGDRGITSIDDLTASMTREANKTGLFESYVDLKDRINKSFNYKANVPDDVIAGVRKASADEARAAQELEVIQRKLSDNIDTYASKLAAESGDTSVENFEKIRNKLDKDLVDFHEYRHLDRTSDVKTVLQDAYKGRLSVKAASSDGIIQKLEALAEDLPVKDYGLELTVDTSGKYVKLSDDWKYIINPSNKNIKELTEKVGGDAAQHISEMSMDPAKLAEKVTRGASYSDETVKNFKELSLRYNLDEDFKKLVDLEESVYNKSNAILNKRFGTQLKTGNSPITDADIEALEKTYARRGVKATDSIEEVINKLANRKNSDKLLEPLLKFADNGYESLNLRSAITKANNLMGDNLGYVRHAYMENASDALKNSNILNDLEGVVTLGNSKIVKNRKYNMSILEANELVVDNLKMNFDDFNSAQKQIAKSIIDNGGVFKDSAIASFDDYLANYPKLAKDSKILDEVLVKSTFQDADKIKDLNVQIRKASKAGKEELVKQLELKKLDAIDSRAVKHLTNTDNTVPFNFRVLEKGEIDRIANKFKSLGEKLGLDDMKDMGTYIKNNGANIAINKDILRLVDINSSSKSINGFSRLYDSMMNFFKRNKTLSPTFQLNNISGNTSNMFLSGMSATDIAKTYPEAAEIMMNHSKIMDKYVNGMKLTSKEQEMLNIWDAFTDAGFGNVKSKTSAQLADMPESIRKYFYEDKAPSNLKEFLVDGLPYLNLKLNEWGDTAARLSTFIHASRNPKYLDNLGVETAGDAVRKVLFDASELTGFEKDVMKKIIPFYTFAKKNLAFQIDNIGRHGKKYNQLVKAYNNLWHNTTNGNEENVDEWMKNNFYLPIPSMKADGSYTVVKTTLPFGELVELLDNPASKLTSSVSPLLKMPAELAINKNTFTGADIEKYPGQMSTNIPFLTKKQEYVLGGLTGLDVPIKNAVSAYKGVADTMSAGGTLPEGVINSFTNQITTQRNVQTDKLNSMYDELDRLENLISKYKDKGYDFSNENELIKANDNETLKRINAMIDKINGAK